MPKNIIDGSVNYDDGSSVLPSESEGDYNIMTGW
jgi:hypothetical protein